MPEFRMRNLVPLFGIEWAHEGDTELNMKKSTALGVYNGLVIMGIVYATAATAKYFLK